MGSERAEAGGRPVEREGRPDPVILELRYRPTDGGSERVPEDDDSGDASRVELARQLNASIYKAGQSFAHPEDEAFELTFFCACGCMAEVKRSLQDYVTQGAIVAGHARPTGGQQAP